MASISKDGKFRRVLYLDQEGKRQSIRLGACSNKAAESFKLHLENLLTDRRLGEVCEKTAEWLGTLDDKMHAKLAAKGLVTQRQSACLQDVAVVAFVDGYIKSRVDVGARTRVIFGDVKANLAAHFGPDKLLRDVTPGDVDQFRLFMVGKHYAEATIRKRLAISKQFFRAALRFGLIKANPFDGQKLQVKGNERRFHFVTMEEYWAVMAVCPGIEWQVLWTMARIGGVRMPSEVWDLRWPDVDFERGVVTVKSPKTAHHGQGHDERQIPLFPELHTILLKALDEAPEGADYVISKHRSKTVNLRTHMERIIRRAGLTPWPKLWQNCRASREIELCQAFPEHVIAKWVGHNQVTARGFYLKVLPSEFERAAGWSAERQQTPAMPAGEAAQKAAQSQATLSRNDQQDGQWPEGETRVFPGIAAHHKSLQDAALRMRGVEPLRAYRPQGPEPCASASSATPATVTPLSGSSGRPSSSFLWLRRGPTGRRLWIQQDVVDI